MNLISKLFKKIKNKLNEKKIIDHKINEDITIKSGFCDKVNAWEEYNSLKKLDLTSYSNIFDIGAHSGSFAVPAFYYSNLKNNKCSVFAFEPVNQNYQLLLSNCKAFESEINLFNSAIFDRNGQINFELGITNTTSRVAEVKPFKLGAAGKKKPLSKTKKILKLNCMDILLFSNFLNQNCLLKLDCEGSEYNILNRLFSNNIFPKCLIIELHPTEKNKPEDYLREIKNKFNIEIISKKYNNGCVIAQIKFID